MTMGACDALAQAADSAQQDARDALDDWVAASEAYDDAGDFLDDSTFWDVAGVAGAVAACAATPVGWVVCGAGIVAGGATITASELGRADEIAAAEAALGRATRDYWKSQVTWLGKLHDLGECLAHEGSKAQRNTP